MPRTGSKRLIPQFVLAHFSHHVCTGVLIPLLPLLREGFGLTYFQAGMLVASFSIFYGIAQVPMAVLADRISPRLIIALGLLGTSMAGICVGFTQSFWQMASVFVAMGLLGGTYHAPASSFISQAIPSEKRGRALGMHFTGGSASFLLTPAMALGIATLFDSWRSSFFILSLPAFLVSAVLWLTTEEIRSGTREQGKRPEDPEVGHNGVGPGERSKQTQISWSRIVRSIGIMVSLSMALQVVFASVNAYLPLYMVDHHGISPKWAGIVISVIAGTGLIGAPLGGAISDRIGRKQIILFSISLSGPFLFAVTRAPFGILLLLSLLFYGIVMSVRTPAMESLIADVVPVGRRTTVLGIYFFLGTETIGLATPIVGRLIDIYGSDPVFTGLAVGVCLVAAIALLFRKNI